MGRPLHSRVAIALGLLLCAAPSRAQQNFCAVCHSQVEVQFRKSAHALENIACTTCHGGNAQATNARRAHARDFRGAPSRAQIPAFCARCHADPEKMRPYGVPTDQYALYQISQHGRRLAEGDAAVAVCTDCHSSHAVLPLEDPASPVHRRNVAATCGRCHGDPALMQAAGLSADVVARYRDGVHGEALRRGDPSAPDCGRCHGSHGAAPPGVGEVNKVCGQCHGRTRDYFRQSPHFGLENGYGSGECTGCHSDHQIARAGPELWTQACAACHAGGSEAARTGQKVLALFTQTQEALEEARRAIARAREIPLDVSDYEARLHTATTYLVEAGPLSHALDLDLLQESTRKARSIASEIQGEIHEKIRAFEGRSLVLILFWFYILVTVALIQYYKRLAK